MAGSIDPSLTGLDHCGRETADVSVYAADFAKGGPRMVRVAQTASLCILAQGDLPGQLFEFHRAHGLLWLREWLLSEVALQNSLQKYRRRLSLEQVKLFVVVSTGALLTGNFSFQSLVWRASPPSRAGRPTRSETRTHRRLASAATTAKSVRIQPLPNNKLMPTVCLQACHA